jgi:DNA-binding MarR family transcriptional regulator
VLGDEKVPTALGDYTGFLLNWLGARSRSRFIDALEGTGLHPRDVGVLTIIARRPGATQQEIGFEASIDASTMVATIDNLEERGLAERRIHAQDRRKRTVHLTRKGERSLEKARDIGERVAADVFGRLSDDEQTQLNLLLRKAAGIGDAD